MNFNRIYETGLSFKPCDDFIAWIFKNDKIDINFDPASNLWFVVKIQ